MANDADITHLRDKISILIDEKNIHLNNVARLDYEINELILAAITPPIGIKYTEIIMDKVCKLEKEKNYSLDCAAAVHNDINNTLNRMYTSLKLLDTQQ